MTWLLDTNVWIQYLKGRDAVLGARIDCTDATDLCVCSVVKAELLRGALGYAKSMEKTKRIHETTRSPSTMSPPSTTRASDILSNCKAKSSGRMIC